MSKYKTRTRFRQADPAGILFFGQSFSLVHDAFEDWVIEHLGSWKKYFLQKSYLVPIRHAECEYLKPLLPGEPTVVDLRVGEIRETSWTLNFAIFQNKHKKASVTGSLTLVFVNPKTLQKTKIPTAFRKVLEAAKTNLTVE